MPDKSKRRRNNKNKRKNKNNRPETCPNEIDGKEIVSPQPEEHIPELEYENQDIVPISESIQQDAAIENIENAQEVSQDHNNNTSNDEDSGNRIPLNEEFLRTKLSLALENFSSRETSTYVVEVPEQKINNKTKLINTVKSKSLDNDDAPKIVEITEDSSCHIEESNANPIIDYSNVIVYDAESDIEWEKIDDLQNTNIPLSKEVAKEIISITTLPLDVAHCEETKTLTPEEEVSLRNYLKTLELSTTPDNIHSLEIKTKIEEIINQEVRHRLRKKGSADDFFIQRVGLPRVLDVIDEEVSGESSATSRRQSYLSDKKSDIEDLDDDVFENKNVTKHKLCTKSINTLRSKPLGHLVQQECLLVEAKLKEPEVSEACGDWTMKTVEKLTGAEVVYLTDSSSSTSSLHEVEDDTDDGIETDVSIRMLTPTIEVTDTENLLKNTFVSCKKDHSKSSSNGIEHIIKVESDLDSIKETKEASHEIVVLSTDDIRTNLYVKELDDCINNDLKGNHDSRIEEVSIDPIADKNVTQKSDKKFDLEIKVIKCELNDAFNNLIKEVTSDSETTFDDNKDNKENTKNDNYVRQDSSSSVSSSQCTAKYNPNYSSLNDVSNMQHDDVENSLLDVNNVHSSTYITSHVKDVIDSIAGPITENENNFLYNMKQPFTLKDFCVRKITSLPYGDKILEELASVSARLQNIQTSTENKKNLVETNESRKNSLPNYHPDPLSSTEKIHTREIVPPPIKPRNSSLKKSQDEEHTTRVAINTEPVYVCLSPSQKMLIEKTNTNLSKDDKRDPVNIHNKFIDRKNHYETYNHGTTIARGKSDDLDEIPPVTPLKSQTGSRLLALICDPSITANVNSLKNHFHNSEEHLQKDHVNLQNISGNKTEISHVSRDFSRTLRPIPLPKPRKFSTSIYESDENSDFTDNSLRSVRNERKVFHFSTGTLNKDIENDISSIQNLHRFYTDVDNTVSSYNVPRRPSLPKDLCDQQMEYIRRKEKEIDAEIQRLEEMRNNFSRASQRKGPRAPLITERDIINEDIKDANNYSISRKRDKVISKRTPGMENLENNIKSSLFNSKENIQKEEMYSEFVTQIAEREERKQQKIIKITKPSTVLKTISKSLSALDILDSPVNNRIEKEFISKARERWEKLGIKDPETEDERESDKIMYNEPKIIEHKIKVIEDGKEKDVQRLPSHLQEFVRFTAKGNAEEPNNSETVMITPTFRARSTSPAVWRPGAPSLPPGPAPAPSVTRSPGAPPPPPPPPVWVPGSAGASPQATRKTFRPVHFEETPPSRRKFGSSDQNGCTSGSESEGRLKTSHSAPVTGLNTLGSPSSSSRLPRAPNPTVTLLQKAREGQISRGASYLQSDRDSARLPRDRPSPPKSDPVHALRKEYASETEVERSDYERGGPRKMADAQKKIEGIGPTTKDGIPVALRSEVKDPSRWYKKMYDTIHKNKYDDDYVTIRYKNRRGQPERISSNKSQYAYFDPRSGYLSEPEGGLGRLGSSTWSDAYDSDVGTGPRRRTASVQEERRSDITTTYLPSNKYSTLASARASQEMYRNQPGRIENYVPGRSSVIDKEAKQWWDEVMDIFDGQNITSTTSLPQASPKEKKDITSAILSKSNMAKALKESGYESDSTLIFRRREDTEAPLSPAERRAAYRDLQAGGEPPLRGFRSPAPPRQDESEIEYIPISSTLTKIRIHKKTPNVHEVICYPISKIEPAVHTKLKTCTESVSHFDESSSVTDCPPAPPRRISSKNSKTLRLVTSTSPLPTATKSSLLNQSRTNVDFLRSKINSKLNRQNTHIIVNKESEKRKIQKFGKFRVTSSSAPPAIDRKTTLMDKSGSKNTIATKIQGTSSFSSSRKMMLPIEYSNSIHSRYSVPSTSVVIERGVGRRTPISNILDKVTSLDKLWSSEKRNEQIDITKVCKSVSRTNKCSKNKPVLKVEANVKPFSPSVTHKSRDMVRTAEKIQRMKISNLHTKSNPSLPSRSDQKPDKSGNLQIASKISKSSLNLSSGVRKQNQIKTAVVTNLNKKKSLESVISKPRDCHASCSINHKDLATKNTRTKNPKSKYVKKYKKNVNSLLSNQFGDSSKEVSNSGSLENLYVQEKCKTKENKHSREVVTNSFFQQLFFGKPCHQVVAYPLYEQNATVLQKAKMFQSVPNDNHTPKLQNSYLMYRKPVSLSRFKVWDRRYSPNRPDSPRSVSWPGRIQPEIRKFDSLSKYENFGSTSSLATVRSKSEPPNNKIYFSQTTRPKSPVVLFYSKEINPDSNIKYSLSPIAHKETKIPIQMSCAQSIIGEMKQLLLPTKVILTETTRPISPILMKHVPNLEMTKKVIKDSKSHSTILFSQISRDTSPKINMKPAFMNKLSRSNSTSPLPTRSPSCRRIHSVRLQSGKHYDTPTSTTRARSAGDANNRELVQDNMQLKTKSESYLHTTDPDYDEYIRDMQNSKPRTERFRELNRYYTYLERVAELEKATSTCDLRHRRKDEEIVDFDRWKKIRAIERAEEELNNLYRKLKIAQDENDVLFYPRNLKDFRWNYDRERGLKIKERSVENLKDHFQQLSHFDSLELEQIPSKDTYKPLWRGTSVAETAFLINKQNEPQKNKAKLKLKPTLTLQTETSLNDFRKRIGLGNRLWSSLSMDQVNALKNQLNAIYSKEFESKQSEKKDCDFYAINVSDSKSVSQNSSLHVRCNSLVTTSYNPQLEKTIKLSKSESIASIPCPITSVKELKNNVNKIQMNLSENDKKKISQTLSKELLNRLSKYDNENKLPLKQGDDGKVMEFDRKKENIPLTTAHFSEVVQESCTMAETVLDDKKRHVVYPKKNIELQHQSSASETETASSDVSNKTIIYRGPSKEVKKKVEYFESVKNISDTFKANQAKENTDGNGNKYLEKKNISLLNDKHGVKLNQIVQSQSCTNIKELFGEIEKNKFLSLPINPEIQSRSMSPHSELFTDRQTPDTQRFSSDETIWRSRSPSPDPERYWRAYFNLAQGGDVQRLVRRFDSPTAVGTILSRHRSDPEIARNVLNKNWSFLEKLSPRRDKSKVMLPVARVPLRTTNRFMPHIDIISKLASLRRRTAPRSRSAEEALECRPGEVNRIRRRFEAMSLLGHVCTSAPDVTELNDIAPYLAGSWIAHRYPKPSDNNRSIKDPISMVRSQTSPIRKNGALPIPKESVKLSSILKIDATSKENFDPSLHRPVSRYEPPRTPPRPPPASWSQRLSSYVTSSRNTVTFQETNSVPEPPRRTLHGSYSDTESPRRYVESDVNIHYRVPVRHDPLPLVPERELARQQAEHMKRLYREQRRTKYLQDHKIHHLDIDLFDTSIKELQDMQNRRHQDNFTPSQKTVVPLNRYDEADKVTAKSLYTFNGQTPRELSFRKGEIIHVRRQIDANWYEGEVHGKIGLFPYNYVEIQKSDIVQSPKKPATIEGRARAKFDFIAQTNLELPLKKGEIVVLSRRIDQNWWEGRNGVKTGIFPDSYVTVLQEPTQSKPEPTPILSTDKPVASPAAHGLLNGTDKRSMGSHSYTPQPNSPALANAPPATQPLPGYVAKPAQATLTPSDRGYGPPTGPGVDLNNAEPLYVDTNAEAVPYRAMYKYRPQNPDELELQEGDTVYVLEKCDDGWYVGSSQRTGRFGTFPGNYVERI